MPRQTRDLAWFTVVACATGWAAFWAILALAKPPGEPRLLIWIAIVAFGPLVSVLAVRRL